MNIGLEHALSAYHPNLPHGAGLIMISKAYFSYFIRNHGCDDRFIELARLLGKSDADKPEDFITALRGIAGGVRSCRPKNVRLRY